MKALLALLFAVPALVSGEILDNECNSSTTWIYPDSVSYSILSRSKYRSLCTVQFDRSDRGKIRLTITGNSLNSSQCQVNVYDRNMFLSKTGGNLNYPHSFNRSVTSDNVGVLNLHMRGSKCDNFGLVFTVQKLGSNTCTGYTCANGQCKSSSAVGVCDGVDDCDDGSDEAGCETCTGYTCANGQCKSSSAVAVCDGVDDCDDGSDEQGCAINPPTICTGYTCANGQCKSLWAVGVCDGVDDCDDGSDEDGCAINPSTICTGYTCDNGQCKSFLAVGVCDGVDDCDDGSDEDGCAINPSTTCTGWTCADGQCKPSWEVDVCDGYDDCDDGSDEWGCGWSTGAYVGTVFGSIAFVAIVSGFSTVIYRRRRVLVARTTVVQPAVVQSRW